VTPMATGCNSIETYDHAREPNKLLHATCEDARA
jgi:hypothetical protein